MRLIDADEFIEALEDLYRHAGWDRREIHFSLADTICNLDMMPTIEAKPIHRSTRTDENGVKWVLGEHGWERKEE